MTRSATVRVLIWIAVTVASVIVISRAHFTADLSAFMPRVPTAEQRLLVDQLREGPASRLILLAIEGATPGMRARASRSLAQRLRSDPALSFVANGETGALERDRTFLFDHRYVLSEAVDSRHFSAEGLRGAIGDTLDQLASPMGLLAKGLVPRDPTGEFLGILERLDETPRPKVADGVWVSSGGRRALILTRTRAAGSDTDAQEKIIFDIRQAFTSSVRGLEGNSPGSLQLKMSGPAVFSVEARATIEHEAIRLSVLSSALIMLLLLSVYRSGTALLLGLVPVVTGALVGVATVALGFGVVHGITLGFGITLIGESVDYSIYLFIQSRAHPGGGTDIASNWIRDYWPTIRLGVLTSVVGFASLLPSAFPGLAQLGVFSVAGLIAAALVTRSVLPSLLPRGFSIRDVSPLGRAVAAGLRHRAAFRIPIAILALAAIAVLYTHRDTLWNRDLSALSPVSTAAQQLDRQLRGDLGAPDASNLVVVSGNDLQSALRSAEAVATALERLVDAGVLAGFETPTRLLPSVAAQRKRLAAMPGRAQLRHQLEAALSGLPLRAERLEPFLRDVEAARTRGAFTRADLEGSSLAAGVDALLIPGEQGWNVLLPLRLNPAGSGIDGSQVRDALARVAPGHATLIDLKHELDKLYAEYLREAVHLSLAALAIITLVLMAVLRSAARVARTVIPLLLAVLVVSGGLIFWGHALTILHLVGMLLTVAVGSNYALFFNRPHDALLSKATDLMLASLLIANAATVAGFGVLAFSSVPVLQSLGATVAPGTLLALIFSALLSRPADSRS